MIAAACERILEIMDGDSLVIGLDGLEYSGKSTTAGIIERGFQQVMGHSSGMVISDLDRELPLSASIFQTVVGKGFTYPETLSPYRNIDLLVKAMVLARDESNQVLALPVLNAHKVAIIDRTPITTTVYQLFLRPFLEPMLSRDSSAYDPAALEWATKYVQHINAGSIGHWPEVDVYAIAAMHIDKEELLRRAPARPDKRELFDEMVETNFDRMYEANEQIVNLWSLFTRNYLTHGTQQGMRSGMEQAFIKSTQSDNPRHCNSPCDILARVSVANSDEGQIAYEVLDNIADQLEKL